MPHFLAAQVLSLWLRNLFVVAALLLPIMIVHILVGSASINRSILYFAMKANGSTDKRKAMLDGVSLDQLRTFVAAADEGSFSAAARRLKRTQSSVSETIANLEAQLDITLFDRAGRYPQLTKQGDILLADARSVVSAVDGMKARAKGIAGGLEPELAAVIDVFFPIDVIADVSHEFRKEFPATPLRLYVEALGGTVQAIMDGRASFGLVGSLPILPPGLVAERVANVVYVMVAAASHPLSSYKGTIPREELIRHIQLVLTDRSEISAGQEFGVISPSTWRLADLFAKHAFLVSGLGWGGMPMHAIKTDLAEGRLIELSIQDIPTDGLNLPMSAVYRLEAPPGPAGRWMIDRLKQCTVQSLKHNPLAVDRLQYM